MKKILPYRVIMRGTGWNQFGPTPDILLSQHETLEAAARAAINHNCRYSIVGPDGSTIEFSIA